MTTHVIQNITVNLAHRHIVISDEKKSSEYYHAREQNLILSLAVSTQLIVTVVVLVLSDHELPHIAGMCVYVLTYV
jgi:hypothetical protein